MKTKKTLTATAIAKTLLMFGMVLMLIAVFCNMLFKRKRVCIVE